MIIPHTVPLAPVYDKCVFHPNHPEVDLCAIDYLSIWETAKDQGKNLYVTALDHRYVLSNDDLAPTLSAVEDVLMVGYPYGLWDEVNNYPIFRKGITATHPAIDFRGKPLAGVDIACFPGSSGSPVLIVHEGGPIVAKTGDVILEGDQGAILLGVFTDGVSMGPNNTLEINRLPTLTQTLPQKKLVVLNLGFYTKANELNRLAEPIEKKFRSQKIQWKMPPYRPPSNR